MSRKVNSQSPNTSSTLPMQCFFLSFLQKIVLKLNLHGEKAKQKALQAVAGVEGTFVALGFEM